MRYAKDNRLLPRGFDPARRAGGHRRARRGAPPTRPSPAAAIASAIASRALAVLGRFGRGSFRLEAVLRYQPIAWRWARNLAAYDAPETRRFVGFYDAAAGESATVLARANVAVDID